MTNGNQKFDPKNRNGRWIKLGPRVYIPCVFMAGLGIASATGLTSWIIFGVYGVASLLTFGAYFIDKAAAKAGRWRTPEKSLHMLSLIGGWPGAMVAQQLIRHKSSKASFQVVFWITVVLNSVVLIWTFTYDPETIGKLIKSAIGV